MQGAHSNMYEHDLGLDDLLVGTFNSILRIEEKALTNRLTEGLTITEIHTLSAVGLYDNNTMSTTAEKLGVTQATLTTAINKLEKLGFVTRVRSDEDRRRVLLSLTADGRKVYRAHRIFHEHMIDEALSGLSPEEEDVLARALTKLKAYFCSLDEASDKTAGV